VGFIIPELHEKCLEGTDICIYKDKMYHIVSFCVLLLQLNERLSRIYILFAHS
jgi:hypothetical protein